MRNRVQQKKGNPLMKLAKTLSGIAAILLAGSSVYAATSNSTLTKDATGGIMVNFALGKFDTGLGTLTGVTLTVFCIEQGYSTVSNLSLTTAVKVKSLTDYIEVVSNQTDATDYVSSSKTFITNPSTAGINGNSLPANTTRSYTINATQILVNNETVAITSDYWAAYSSIGGVGTVSFDAVNAPNISVTGAEATLNNNNVTANTTLTLTYTYDVNPGPVPVPEASTVIVQLLIVGAGIGLFVIRRRRTLAAVRA